MRINSADFGNQSPIPPNFTCDGSNISPRLAWSGVPSRAESLALVMEDPDAPAGTWVHWLVYNIPPDAQGLPAQVPATSMLPDGARQGTNSFRKTGYGGPCPPPGHGPHRYFFRLYALDQKLDIPPAASRADLDAAMKGHILGRADLMGRFERRKQ